MNYLSTHKLKSFLIIFFSFIIFIAISKSQPQEVVFVPYTGDADSFVSKLREQGLLGNQFSEVVLRAFIAFRGGVEPGGYAFSRGMGAVSAALSLDEPQYKYVSVIDGFRKGQIAQLVGKKLNWDQKKIQDFGKVPAMCPLVGQEGYFASGTYLIHVEEDANIVGETMQQSFNDVLKELGIDEKTINVPQTITIASLIQREAAGKSDMRLISGIIHKRLTVGMPLQIDATLQYIKGDEDNWWPVPTPQDKQLDSPFNTYQNTGLPPSPIATPSKDAIRAALNPMKTDCLFYLHDNHRNIHCSTNYKQHIKNIQYYLK
jgi:UPF0755 protein